MTVTGAISTLSGGLTVANGSTLTGGNFTMTSTGTFEIQTNAANANILAQDILINSGTTVGQTTIINGNDITIGNTNSAADLTFATPPALPTSTTWSNYANVLTVTAASSSTYADTGGTFNLNTNFANGSVVYVYFTNTPGSSSTVVINGGSAINIVAGLGLVMMKDDSGIWRIISSGVN